MKGRGLSALLTQRVRGPETLARGTPSPTQPKEPSRSPGFWQLPPFTQSKGFPFHRLLHVGQPHLRAPQDWELPTLSPKLDHNSLVEYMSRSDAV